MHLRYVPLLVATSVAITSFAESASNVSISHPPPDVSAFKGDRDTATKGLDTHLSPAKSATHLPPETTTLTFDQEYFNASSVADEIRMNSPVSSKLYKILHDDVNLVTRTGPTLQRQLWKLANISPEKLFDNLHLYVKPDETIFENTVWKNWAIYVCKKEKRNIDSASAVVQAMSREIGEKKLVTILEKGIENPPTHEIAVLLKEANEKLWLDHREPTDVFRGLKLDEHAEDLFSNVLYPTWSNFVRAYGTEHKKIDSTDLLYLKQIFDHDNDLLTVLTSAKNMNNGKGREVLNQFIHEQSDSTTFFVSLMHSRKGLRVYFTKHKLHGEKLQDEIVTLTDPMSDISIDSLRKLRNFMSKGYPNPEDVLRALPDDDPILTTWLSFMKISTVNMPVTGPEIKTIKMLSSKDIKDPNSRLILYSFVKVWVNKSVKPSKVYKLVLYDEGQEAKKLQDVWKTFIDAYKLKAKFLLPNKSPPTFSGIHEVANVEGNEHETPREIKTFMKLSAKALDCTPDELATMRSIVWNWAQEQEQPEQVLKTLLLDAHATRLLDHWVGYISEFLKPMKHVRLDETMSLPSKDLMYSKMLRMLSAGSDLGHPPSRKIMNKHLNKWAESGMSPQDLFAMLELANASKQQLLRAKKLLNFRAGKASKSVRMRSNGSPKLESPPSAKASPTVRDDQVATLIDKAFLELLDNPLLPIYLDFMNRYNERHMTSGTLLTTLQAAFEKDDVANLLNAAKKHSTLKQGLQKEVLELHDEARVSLLELFRRDA